MEDENYMIASALWLWLLTKDAGRAVLVVADGQQHRAVQIRHAMKTIYENAPFVAADFYAVGAGYENRRGTMFRQVRNTPEALAGIFNDYVMIVFVGQMDARMHDVAQAAACGAKEFRLLRV